MLLPVVGERGKGIKKQKSATAGSFMVVPSTCVNDTDTESCMARLGKIPLWPMGIGDIAFAQVEQPAGAEQSSPPRLSPHGGSPLDPSLRKPYPELGLMYPIPWGGTT